MPSNASKIVSRNAQTRALRERTWELLNAGLAPAEVAEKLEAEGFRKMEVLHTVQEFEFKKKEKQKAMRGLAIAAVGVVLGLGYAVWLIASGENKPLGLSLLLILGGSLVVSALMLYVMVKWLRKRRQRQADQRANDRN